MGRAAALPVGVAALVNSRPRSGGEMLDRGSGAVGGGPCREDFAVVVRREGPVSASFLARVVVVVLLVAAGPTVASVDLVVVVEASPAGRTVVEVAPAPLGGVVVDVDGDVVVVAVDAVVVVTGAVVVVVLAGAVVLLVVLVVATVVVVVAS